MAINPSTFLSEVLRGVQEILGKAANPVPVLIGDHYLEDFGAGSHPRVLFVFDPRGKAGPPLEIGAREIGSRSHGCDVYVRGAEDGSDVGRFDAAHTISDVIMNAIEGLVPGRITKGAARLPNTTPTGVDAYGADDSWGFVYKRAVYYDQEIFDAAYAIAQRPAGSPPDTDRLNGDTGQVFSTAPTLSNAR